MLEVASSEQDVKLQNTNIIIVIELYTIQETVATIYFRIFFCPIPYVIMKYEGFSLSKFP